MAATAMAGVVRWDPIRMIQETVNRLTAMQEGPVESRDIDRERGVARVAGEYLHQHDNQDFMIFTDLEVKYTFWVRYLCKADLAHREDWQRCAVALAGSVEEASRLVRREIGSVRSYFDRFRLGSDMGYPELGMKWFFCVADESGSYFVPVEAVESVVGTSF